MKMKKEKWVKFEVNDGKSLGSIVICTYVCAAPCAVPPLWPACVACLLLCGTIAFTLCALIGVYGISPGCEWLCCQV
mgnify:CR=1 FL=1